MAGFLDTDISSLKGVGPQRAKLFQKLGVADVGGLLRLYPRDYQDWSCPLAIAEAPLDELCVVRAQIVGTPTVTQIKGGRLVIHASADDGQSPLRLTFFNNRYIPRLLLPGHTYLFRGKMTRGRSVYSMTAPDFTAEEKAGSFVPVYPSPRAFP